MFKPRRRLCRWLVSCALSAGIATEAYASDAFRWLAIEGRQVRWYADHGKPLVLEFAIATAELRTANAINCGAIVPPAALLDASSISPVEFRRAVYEAFAVWQRHIAITFVEVSDQAVADIVIGEQARPVGHAFANVTINTKTGGAVAPIEKAAICLNPLRPWKIGYDGNLSVYDLVHTVTHEIGHAIGLDHPASQGHVMSFKYHELRDGLSEGDVRGAIKLYGQRRQEHSLARDNDMPAPQAINSPAARTRSDHLTSRSAAEP